ncbi:DNA-binding transcriptional regulator IdnR [Acerihabitans sp.]|uniref:DNA-binding transcriptional regulator IdnR n=1 Tax=Acerihabitans sp. TaxID=2811394 RepID=UPI002EDA611A
MKKYRVSMQDIATFAGVTKTTVSRYLRTPEKVAKATGAKIAGIIEELNYIPNRAPEMMLNSISHSIGILVPSFNNQVFSDVLAGIESVTSVNNYQTLIANYNYSKETEEQQIVNLLSYSIDGIILMEKEHTLRSIKSLLAAKIPIVEVMDTREEFMDIQVGYDNQEAAFDMMSTVLASGKRRVVYLGARDDLRDRQRYQGYARAMKSYHLNPLMLTANEISSFSLGADIFNQALKRFPDLDGLFCTNDDIAVGALLECLRQNIPVPGDIAIAGFHGLDIGRAITPRLASVITPRIGMGKCAAEMVLKKIRHEDVNYSIDLGYQIFKGGTI